MAGAVCWLPPRLLLLAVSRPATLQQLQPTLFAAHNRHYNCPPTPSFLRPVASRPFSSQTPPQDDKGADDGASPMSREDQQTRAQQLQTKRPWHREDVDQPPADKIKDTGRQHTKGKLLTTPNRLLKLTLPLPVGMQNDKSNKDANIEPLSLFLHPQQPISYVERLIQAELPPLVDGKGRERPPNVYFWAEDTGSEREGDDGGSAKTRSSHVAAYSGLGHEAAERRDADKSWVRWGSSTEMGDFIREAARGREFAIQVEGDGGGSDGTENKNENENKNYIPEIRVSVPSFADRTYYQRMRLRRLSTQIQHQASIKQECDALAHRSARRLAKGGFGVLVGWWATVYYVTFLTEYGWDLVEPVTYLASLTLILGGYFWFLYISRDLSYKAAMNVTVSRHQTTLYETRGFDVRKWERLVEEANGLRAEIRRAAYEYDVDWDEAADLGGENVKKVLEKEVKREKAKKEREEADEAEAEEEAEGGEEEEVKKGEKGGEGGKGE
ncbi:hypothetical protein SCUCBS95973_002245 [Sporothrix curviconia]|uniref:Calcium uniporter protein n=1 Tax=Sporothrix curviconia TaxID=1260050 RepID=A0ABP0B5C8_9PEZI